MISTSYDYIILSSKKIQFFILINVFITYIASAFVANFFESFIGATFQSDKFSWLSNELVNLINTAVGAALAIALYSILIKV